MGLDGTRGILNPRQGLEHFELDRFLPAADLRPWVDNYWTVRWDLEGRPSFAQEVLPYPCVTLAFEEGKWQVHGPRTARFVAQLSGRGRVFGTKFTPAGFSAFAHVAVRTLVDRVLPLHEATGRTLALPVDDAPQTVQAAIEAYLRSFEPTRTAPMLQVDELVNLAQHDRSIARADDLARAASLSLRSLHRAFERYVGVGPKWIVRRARVQEAAERVARGERVDWARVAQELGYHDQAHLIRDFSAQVGETPAAYARKCADLRSRS